MAKKFNIKYTNKLIPVSSSSEQILVASNSFDELIDDSSSVHLISITDEESGEDNSDCYNVSSISQRPTNLDLQQQRPQSQQSSTATSTSDIVRCTVVQDEIDLIDAKILAQKAEENQKEKDKKDKKSAGNKMDKFMKHLQEALSPSSSSSSSNLNIDSSTNPSSTVNANEKKDVSDSEDCATTGKSTSKEISWLQEIKSMGNFVNNLKLKNEKQTSNKNAECNQELERKLSLASGVKNHYNFLNNNQQQSEMDLETKQTRASSITMPNLINSNDIDATTLAEIMDNENNNVKTRSKSEKETVPLKKKFTLFEKKDKDKDNKTAAASLAKLISPTKTSNSSSSFSNIQVAETQKNLPQSPPSPSLTSTLLSPTNTLASISTSSPQVFSNFFSNFTKTSGDSSTPTQASTPITTATGLASSNQTSKSNTNPISSSRSASSENVNNIKTEGDSKTKAPSKIPASKSMMTFLKPKIEEEANNNQECDDMSNMLYSFGNSANPTLRKRFTVNTSNNNAPLSPSKTKESVTPASTDAVSSDESSSQSSIVNQILQDIKTNDKMNQTTPTISSTSYFGKSQPHQHHQKSHTSYLDGGKKSLWNKLTSSNKFHYYIFLFMAISSVFFLCISPLPSFLNGFIFGFLMTFFIITITLIYLIANFFLIKSDDKKQHLNMDTIGLKRTRSKRLAANVPSTSMSNQSNQDLNNQNQNVYAGWVYEFIGDYTEREKNGFVSRMVYCFLSGYKLTIFVPSQEMNEKRLKQISTDSNRNTLSFSSQKVIDFSKTNHKRISLYLTKNVRNQRKYIWSKKYPICIEFNAAEANRSIDNVHLGKEEAVDALCFSTPSTPVLSKLVIFARTCREKEEWFWAIKNSIDCTIAYRNSNSTRGSNNSLTDSPSESKTYLFVNGSDTLTSPVECADASTTTGHPHHHRQYLHILTRRKNYSNFMRTNIMNAEGIGHGNSGMMTALTWFNVLLNRLSFDILNKPNWSAYVAKKLQRKLKKLRLPYFCESLIITEIDIGSTLPKFNSVPSVPTVDDAGLWIEFDVSYSGGFTMTLETKINLLKLSANVESLAEVSPASTPNDSPKLTQKIGGRYWRGYKAKYRNVAGTQSPGPMTDDEYGLYADDDSDLDSILTSSEDEEPETAPAAPDDADTDEKQKRLIRYLEKITSKKAFQKASQMNFFKKALEGVSNMSIMLTVQINSLNGILAINIPEPPTDRLWYGFKQDPTIQITARPKIGDHDLNMSYVTNLIEKKLRTEFFNYFVIPNMDDFFIPALNTSIEQYINVVP